ncbi:MAG: hypothetical protein CL824_02135 [Crocinitomicaceae bacterium]|nr:hypothetical protein [Crocinitomicaceae bacterium]
MRFAAAFLLFFAYSFSHAQHSSWRIKKFKYENKKVRLDTLSIYPNSFILSYKGDTVSLNNYRLNFSSSTIELIDKSKFTDTLIAFYRVIPFDLSKKHFNRDTSILYNPQKGNRDNFIIKQVYTVDDVFGGSELNKSGSISRGISFGNKQDLGINSSLNLELSGQLSPNLKLLASLSDANIPIQPDGTTNKLQEFDKVFIQVYNDQLKIIAGDFWINKPQGYFLTYKKRGQGLNLNYKWTDSKKGEWSSQISGALSKGKFSRQIIPGIEANQGPYRLVGNLNEPYVIVLSGTERIYIDGKLLKRGQEYDYTIDYNTAEIIFTSRNLITKDTRIVAEFQYSDQNYARSLFQGSIHRKTEKMEFWINTYSEQDAKNQPLQQNLNDDQKNLLSQIGDSLNQANSISIDSVGFIENQILYKLIDSLSFDSILVFSVDNDSAKYRATFLNLGQGNGDYILDNQIALGKIYKWVAPIAGIKQGEYAPVRVLASPKQKRFISSGIKVKLSKNSHFMTEVAYSENDLNTFSKVNNNDNEGYSVKSIWVNNIKLKPKDSLNFWSIKTSVDIEALSADFSPIEQYRTVEFNRDWNTRGQNYTGTQFSSNISGSIKHQNKGEFELKGQQYLIGEDYNGYRLISNGVIDTKKWKGTFTGSLLSSDALEKNNFLRHKTNITRNFKFFKLGYIDDHEKNVFNQNNGNINLKSYQFFDYQFFISNGDSTAFKYKLFYRERYDWKSDSIRLKEGAKATTTGLELNYSKNRKQNFNFIVGYRQLKIIDSILMPIPPENTMIGRFEYNLRLLKGAFTFNSFYEVGSGLEQRKDFIYIKVNDGQGIYTWIDYNQDGIQDLNEFEVAQFIDQASYIRVFTPSAEYVNTYSNEFNQGIFWRPERIWSQKKGVLKILSKFSNQFRIRAKRKTNIFDTDLFNPFENKIEDINLIQTYSTIRNSLYFNRISNVFASEYRFQETKSKNLLATGFDGRSLSYHELSTRWNILPKLTWEVFGKTQLKESKLDYTINRNYAILENSLKSLVSFQPNTKFRISLEGSYSEKKNTIEYGGETCFHSEAAIRGRFNKPKKEISQVRLKLFH